MPHSKSNIGSALIAALLIAWTVNGVRGEDAPSVRPAAGKKTQDASAKAQDSNPAEKSAAADKTATSGKDDARRYTVRRIHDPNGIGKFYMDREIAHVMGFAGVDWLERDEREEEESLSKLIESLEFQPGMVVADIGAGSGVLTLQIAAIVGDTGKVVAVDVQQEMLDRLAKKMKLQKIDNVELVLGTEKSPKLPKASIDLALMVDVYHEFAFPYEMLRDITAALKPGGRIVFVEYRKEDPEVPIKEVHKMSQAQVKKEAALPEFQLKFKQTIDVLPRQHIIIFERTSSAPPQPTKPE